MRKRVNESEGELTEGSQTILYRCCGPHPQHLQKWREIYVGHTTYVSVVDDAHDTTHNFIFEVKFQFPRFYIRRLPYIGHICATFFIWPKYYIYAQGT